MSKKSSSFFEEHVEKIVLAVVVVGCIVLSYFFVIKSHNAVSYDKHKIGPSAIDNYILSKQAEVLESRLNRKPEPKQPYERRSDDFVALFDSAIGDIDVGFRLPQPIISSRDISDNRVYRIPLIGEVNEVAVEHIRAVAYVPEVDVDEENVYGPDNSEPNDIDFVTVEAKFDVSELYKGFNESFAREHIQQDWRDPCIARPVFAAVQLQRQELLTDGGWSDWQTVPRSKIDHRKRMFEVIEDVNNLPAGGIKVRLLQFDDKEVRTDLLQPEAYQIASAKKEWFPPFLHKKYVEYQREINVLERREAAAEKREEREREEGRSERRSRTARPETRPAGGITSQPGMGTPMGTGRGTSPAAPARRTPTRRSRADRRNERERPQREGREVSQTIGDVYREFDEILITDKTDLARMDKPLLFWAHDDTVEPAKSYHYRIRLGVFNPIAGTNQVSGQDKSMKNKVILWSKFSDTTETIDIPGTLYFFPYEIQEAAKAITVQVSRYMLGYWYSKDFTVKQGELIGKVSEYNITEEEEGVTVPKTVDYATSAVLVDVIPVNDWSGGDNLRARHFFDMLYSFDGKDIERLPIKTRYWAEALQIKFNEIKRSEKEPKEPLRSWGGRPSQRRRAPVPGVEGIPSGMTPYPYGPPRGY